MSDQIFASPSNKKISELYNRIKEESLIPQPDFQRKFVWNRKHKEEFIETILKGYPFPEIYIAQSGIDVEKIETQEFVVDGQQRLSTIVQYIEESDDSKEFGRLVKKYTALSEEEQKKFLNYNVVVRDLGDIESKSIIEIFRRINLTQYSLKQVEIHNAVYDGEFISTAKEIVNEIDQAIFPEFSETELSRMYDLHFVLLLLSTVENGGFFAGNKEIETYIIQYNDEYENSLKIKKSFLKTFDFIKKLDFSNDSIWNRKSNYFTLFTELYYSKNKKVNIIKEKLKNFEIEVIQNKTEDKEKNEYAKYYSYMYAGTNSRQARITRSNLFKKYVIN